MTVYYEWDVELVRVYDDGDNDVVEHYHQASYTDCLALVSGESVEEGHELQIVLVCDDDNCRSWAYVIEGEIEEEFENALGEVTRKVPQRFRKEIALVHAGA